MVPYTHQYNPPYSKLLIIIIFVSWSGLDNQLVYKYMKPSINTGKGHLNDEIQHIQSTQPPPTLDENINTIKTCLRALLQKKKIYQSVHQIL